VAADSSQNMGLTFRHVPPYEEWRERKMPKLMILMILAAASLARSAKAQRTLPQTRMYEYMRDADGLNRAMESANGAVNRQQSKEQAIGALYLRLILPSWLLGTWVDLAGNTLTFY
jgi:hypothetical protein